MKRTELPDLELACLRLLWSGDLTVGEVRDRLRPQRQLAYTTVMTVLDRLARKGAVSRRKIGRTHLYHAEFGREAARESAVRRLLDYCFEGSREALLAFLGAASGAAPSAAPRGAAASVPASPPQVDPAFDESLL